MSKQEHLAAVSAVAEGDERSLARRVAQAIEADGLSIAQASKQVGVSSSALSTWLRGVYRGDSARMDQRAQSWLAVRDERRRRGAPLAAHSALLVTDEIELMLAHAQARADCVLIYGLAGAGKSYAARRYAAAHSQVALATMSPAITTALGTLHRVAAAVGVAAGQARSAAALEDVLVERLMDRSALLVVDEAHHLSQALLDELRCLHDRAGCGLALLGNEPLYQRLASGERSAQLVSRIGLRKHLGLPCAADVDLLARDLLRREPGAEERKLLRSAARRAGGLRALNKLVFSAYAFALGADRKRPAAEDLAAAAEEAA